MPKNKDNNTTEKVAENVKEDVKNEDIDIDIKEPIKISLTDDKKDVDEANKKISEYKDIAQRIQAEFDNYRKRNAEAVRVARNDGIDDVISALFPVLDNFERGLAVLDEKAKNGVELIYKQTVALLSKYEVTEISALGEVFNPTVHHAIAQCAADGENANTVVEVFQKGYKRKDKVLRPAMVKVAQ